jgi:hypothetical protein
MVSDEKGLPVSFNSGQYKGNTEEIDMATTRSVRWVAKLGSQAYGNPTVRRAIHGSRETAASFSAWMRRRASSSGSLPSPSLAPAR